MAIDAIGNHRFSQCAGHGSVIDTTGLGLSGLLIKGAVHPMATMTENEWQSFVTAGTRLAHIALTRADGRPHVTPVCFILDGDELAFVLSPGSVKGKSLARDQRIAVCVSDERQPYGFVTMEGHARTSTEPDQIKHVAVGIAERYYPSEPAEEIAETFVREGFTAVRINISNVIARSGLG
jgi:PPOX class probable F420-dependent enzyme